jgi:hypothetical protein
MVVFVGCFIAARLPHELSEDLIKKADLNMCMGSSSRRLVFDLICDVISIVTKGPTCPVACASLGPNKDP